MSRGRSLTRAAARVLSEEAARSQEIAPSARAAAVGAIAHAIRVRKRRQRIRWGGVGALAFVASIALAAGLARLGPGHDGPLSATPVSSAAPSGAPTRAGATASDVRGSPHLERDGMRSVLADGATVATGDRISVDRGSAAVVAIAGGSRIYVNDETELRFGSVGPRTDVELGSGSVSADVAKLHPGERFVIRTVDVEIEVHGTRFEVTRSGALRCGSGTGVRVREGIVAVRAHGVETLVTAGESWPGDCGATFEGGDGGIGPIAAPSAPVPAPSSSLAAQNDLYERALAQKTAGDPTLAIASFDELVTRYPASHLAQSARAERMKLLHGVDRERARAAARDYLKRYPAGFARADAEMILGE